MSIAMIVLRLIHILSGVFWVGGAMINSFFLAPAVAATGEAGQKTMGHIITKGKMSVRITVAAVLTVLAGAALYWIDSHGFSSPWTSSSAGLGFGIGAIFGIIGLVFGYMVGQNVTKLGRIGAAAQGKPTPEQIAQLQGIQKQLAMVSKISTFSLIIALACMATARYWGV